MDEGRRVWVGGLGERGGGERRVRIRRGGLFVFTSYDM